MKTAMKTSFLFRKPCQEAVEGEIANAIVLYQKRAWQIESVLCETEPNGVAYKTFVSIWKYRLRIDLWLAIIDLSWERKGRVDRSGDLIEEFDDRLK